MLLSSTRSARYFSGFPTGYSALLGGLTENGRSAVNVLSFLCLDAYQSVQLPQPNLGVRTNALIDTPFLMKTAETIRLGTGIPQIFNDEVVVPAFLNRGVSLEDARDYSVVGCVELSIPGLGVRTNALIDTPFLMKTAETIRLGTGIPQIFNDEVVVPAFLNRGVSREDARDYSVVGCVELSIPGRTYGLHDIAMFNFNDEVVVPAFLNRGVSREDARDYSVVGCVELSIPGRTYGLHDIAMFNLLKVMEICLYENEGNAALTYEGLLEQIRAKISHYITLMVEGSNICDIVNVLSFLCLDAYQSVQLPQPNLGVRTNALIDTPFLMKTAETIRLGTGIPQIFNDEVVVPAFLNRGVSLEDARDYSVVGCVELSIPGRTYGLHDIAMFNLLKVMEICLYENEGNAALTYEGLLEQIRAKISHYISLMVEGSNICDIGHRDWAPVPLLSSFISDCLEKGRDITDGGARYNFSGVQGIGIANLSDSLHALKGMVFEQQRLSFDELLSVLKANFATPEGEKVRARLINRFEKYGNDIDEVDNISTNCCRY